MSDHMATLKDIRTSFEKRGWPWAIEALDAAIVAMEPISDAQVERAWEAAQKRQARKTFSADPKGMIRVILEAGRG